MKPSEMTHPIGWANFSQTGRGKEHWFGMDGRSLCGKKRNNTFNILSKETTDGCGACSRKLAALAKAEAA